MNYLKDRKINKPKKKTCSTTEMHVLNKIKCWIYCARKVRGVMKEEKIGILKCILQHLAYQAHGYMLEVEFYAGF